jgi:hypothetical protein
VRHLALFAVCLLEFQGIDEVDGLEEPHPVAEVLDRLDAERGGQMGLAGAGRRSTARMRASSSRGLNGFGRESSVPTSSPTMRSTSSPRADKMMIGRLFRARNRRAIDKPSSPGSMRSRITRSG